MEREKPKRQEKTRICIRIDSDLLNHFKRQAALTVTSEDPIGYQGLINEALRQQIETEAELQRILDTGDYTVVSP